MPTQLVEEFVDGQRVVGRGPDTVLVSRWLPLGVCTLLHDPALHILRVSINPASALQLPTSTSHPLRAHLTATFEMQNSAVQRLPTELQIQVLEFLPLSSDLAALSTTCKALRRVAEPFLYTSIHLHLDNTCGDPPIGLFLRTLLERSDLTACVHHLQFEGHRQVGLRWDPSKDKLPSRVVQPEDKLDEAIKSLNLRQEDRWQHEVQAGHPGATVSLAISLCPNLTHLRMDHNWLAQARFLDRLLQKREPESSVASAAHDPKSHEESTVFRSLQSIELFQVYEVQREVRSQNINNALHLFYLPNLQQLSVPLVNPTKFSWPLKNKPNPSNLVCLELARVRECFLGDVLSPLKSLRRLRYNWLLQENLDRHVNENSVVDLDAMVNAVLPLGETLEELIIHATTSLAPDYIEPPLFWLKGSLRGISRLKRLQRLQLPWDFVVGVWEVASTGSIAAVVPVGLERLALQTSLMFDSGAQAAIHDWEDSVMLEYVRNELESRALPPCSDLREIVLPGPDYDQPKPEIAAEVARLSKEFKISLLFYDVVNPPSDD